MYNDEQYEIKPYTAEQQELIDDINNDIRQLAKELGLN